VASEWMFDSFGFERPVLRREMAVAIHFLWRSTTILLDLESELLLRALN
jgi:hypothetical protein